jgi:F-type H+-transporting ATPase subunit a
MEDGIEVIWNIPFFNIPITNVVVMSWIAMAAIIIWAFVSTRNMKLVPVGLQKSAETVVEWANNFVTNIMGSQGKAFAPYIGTIILFLGISNTVGALFLSELTGGIIGPSTRGLAIPVALAGMTMVIAVGAGIYKRGIIGWVKKLFKPLPFLLPFNLLDYITKPLSLSMRLFGNILGAYVLMEMLIGALPIIFPSIACLYFDIFDGGLQAFVFTLLTTLYISEEVSEEEE